MTITDIKVGMRVQWNADGTWGGSNVPPPGILKGTQEGTVTKVSAKYVTVKNEAGRVHMAVPYAKQMLTEI